MKCTLPLLLPALVLAATITLAQDAAQLPSEIVYDHLTSGMTYPKVVHQTFPQYTDQARKKKIQGVVMVSLVVTPEGRVRDPKVTKSVDKDLDKQALACVSDWTFQPATKDGQPVAMRIAVETAFHLY
jgi:protein TonB